MISRKKRVRYLQVAARLAKENNELIDLNSWEEVWNIIDKYGEQSYVYIIGCPELQQVKIGKSKNPGQRLDTLQTGFPYKLQLWAFCLEHDELTEKNLHKKLKKDRIQGEWFTLSTDVKDLISKMQQASKS